MIVRFGSLILLLYALGFVLFAWVYFKEGKVVVAREIGGSPALLIASQPTRGVDVGSIEFIHRQLISRRDAGLAVLLVSSELDEVLSLSDRVAVIYRGRIVAVLEGDAVQRERIGLLMAGAA